MATNATGQFSVSNGQIIDSDGNQFIARGINVFLDQVDAATILKTFPGINAVRLATTPGADSNAIDAMVQGLTSKGVVVLIEDHSSSGGNMNTSSGQALTNEASWYAGLASKYRANPNVWFGTANEPDDTANMATIPAQEAAIYNAIRGIGSNAMVMMEMRGGFTNDAAQQSASTYAGMRNVAWDTHYYGWVTNQSTNPATIASGLQNQIANAQSVRSADGTMPVVIGEYGPSTSGIAGYDANGLQVVQAVDDSGKGTFAWAFSAGTDTLTTDGTNLSDFGQMVAQHIATGGPAPISPPVIGAGPGMLGASPPKQAFEGQELPPVTLGSGQWGCGWQPGPAQSVYAAPSQGQSETFDPQTVGYDETAQLRNQIAALASALQAKYAELDQRLGSTAPNTDALGAQPSIQGPPPVSTPQAVSGVQATHHTHRHTHHGEGRHCA